MSFSDIVKTEICTTAKKHCCRRALLNGMLAIRGVVEENTVSLYINNTVVLNMAELLIVEIFGREPYLTKRTGGALSYKLHFVYRNANKTIKSGTDFAFLKCFDVKCSSCRQAFLAGIFLACGRISDPQKQYLLEFSCGERREALADFLQLFSLFPKYVDRRNEKLLYFRDSTSIEEFLANIGVTHATFEVMDKKIEHEMRNNANRLANCDANNISKSIQASMRQIELIQRLIDENKISFLPPELVETAYLRLKHDGLSIAQLAAIADPPLTKSGINHRLQKIATLAEGLLDEKGGT